MGLWAANQLSIRWIVAELGVSKQHKVVITCGESPALILVADYTTP